MRERLKASQVPGLLSVNMTSASGTFWGISSGTGVHPVSGRDRGPAHFIELGHGNDIGPFDGLYYAGRHLFCNLASSIPLPGGVELPAQPAPTPPGSVGSTGRDYGFQ
jgi:hypothetical protein